MAKKKAEETVVELNPAAAKKAAIAERLERIRNRDGGVIKIDRVIEDARNPDSPLHSEYKWNVEEAAMEYWRIQTRAILRSFSCPIVYEDRVLAAPFYVHDPASKNKEDGYVALANVRKDGDKARDILAAELSRARSAMDRAHAVAVALGLADEVSEVIERLELLRSHLSEAA